MKQQILITAIFITATYVTFLILAAFVSGRDYSCVKNPKYRIDYIFPARQIACYFYEEL